MRKAFEVIAGLSFVASAKKATFFEGEHADKRHIDHGDGRHSLKMKAVRTNMNKYESVLYRGDDLFQEKMSLVS